MRKKILFLAGMMACSSLAGAQEISKTWVADKGNGTYQNPVLHADYSDPDICAAGDDFYMTAGGRCFYVFQLYSRKKFRSFLHRFILFYTVLKQISRF